MYGHHNHNVNQHSAGYNATDSNYYPTGYDLTNQTNTHQYPNYGYHYEEPVSYLYTNDSLETPPSPQDLNYYHPTQQVHHQDNSIINTDSGLSYTNLDYTNSNPLYQTGYNDNYNNRAQDVLLSGRHHQDDVNHHHHQVHHSAGNYMHDGKFANHHNIENDGYHHQHHVAHQSVPTSSCMEYQHLHRYKETDLATTSDNRLRHHNNAMHNMSTTHQQQQPMLPTYKWMQVKRNVPKPSGK